jgi:hypothetical protein
LVASLTCKNNVLVATRQQNDVGQGADAAHAHDLAGHVQDLEPFQQLAPIIAEGGPVGAEPLMELVFDLVAGQTEGGFEVAGRDNDRRLADDPVVPVDQLTELRQRLQAVAGASLRGLLAYGLLLPPGDLGLLLGSLGGGAAHRLQQLVLVQAGIPDLHRAHRGEAGHRLPVGLGRLQRRRARVALAEAVVAPSDREAGRHPLHVVLERPRQGLVKVVHVEHQPPLGRGERPEVRQVRVAAQLHVQAGRWRARQVGGHDFGRAPVEGERRHQHPPVADRYQVGLTAAILLLEQPDRVGAVTGRCPPGVAGQRRLVARRLAPRPAFLDAGMRDPVPRGRRLRPRSHRLRTSRLGLQSA